MQISQCYLNQITELLGYTPTILFQFNRAFLSWECDSVGWIINSKQGKQIILTNHGSPYIASTQELQNDIHRYEQLISDTEEALNTLK
jgi:hypothetical protein